MNPPTGRLLRFAPAEEPGVVAFRESGDVTLEDLVGETEAEWELVLLLITVDRVGRAYALWTHPDHVVVPSGSQQFCRHEIVARGVPQLVPVDEVGDHAIDQLHCCCASRFILTLVEQTIVGPGPGMNEGCSGLRRERVLTGLAHDAHHVCE